MPGKPPKAKNPVNQPLVDRVFQKRASLPPRRPGQPSHLASNLRNAEENLRKLKQAVTSYSQALAVKGVGPKIAYILFPDGGTTGDGGGAAAAASSRKPAAKRKAPPSSSQSSVHSTLPSLSQDSLSSSVAVAAPQRQRRPPAPDGSDGSGGASAKARAYARAVAEATTWRARSRDLLWKVVLIVDEREREKAHMESKCLMAKIPCERRTLPIGDMAWIAQAFLQGDRTETPVVELMLGTIIERKSIDDLVASIHGSRYMEQRRRMKESGLPQLLFLVEGDLHKDSRCMREFKMCYTAMYETRLHLGFQILQTANMADTVQTLKRLHRRILKRTFPSAFYAEALPIFNGPGLDHRQIQTPSAVPATATGSPDLHSEPLPARRRRQNESLQDMRFDVEPVPFGGMERFITYQEFKAKVEMSRENATRSVGMIHAAMLKQVPRVERKKVQAIINAYPTPSSLFSTYDELPSEQRKRELVCYLPLMDETQSNKRFIGPQSSMNVYMAYGMSRAASERKSLDGLIQQMKSRQEAAAFTGVLQSSQQESKTATSQGSRATRELGMRNHAATASSAASSFGACSNKSDDMTLRAPAAYIDLSSPGDEKPAARTLESRNTAVSLLMSARNSPKRGGASAEGVRTTPMSRTGKFDATEPYEDDNDADVGSEYEYSPIKPFSKRHAQASSSMEQSFVDIKTKSVESKSHSRLDFQAFMMSSDDDDNLLGESLKRPSKRPLTDISSNVMFTSEAGSGLRCSKAVHQVRMESDVWSLASSRATEPDDVEAQSKSATSEGTSRAHSEPQINSKPLEVIDLIDDD